MITENNTGNQPIMVHVENYTGDKPIEVIYREDKPIERLNTIQAKLPEPFFIEGIISAPADWLNIRNMEFDHNNARIEVDREFGTIELIINERNCHGPLSEHLDGTSYYNVSITGLILQRSTVTGAIQFTDIFRKLKINDEETWHDPQRLASFFRLNRSIFPDIEENMRLVSALKNIKAKINAEYEKSKDTFTGSRTEFYQQTVEHTLPQGFDICIAIFKGEKPEKYNVEFDVDIVDGKILLQLKSPAINDMVETSRDALINAQLDRIRQIAPEIVIIEK